MATTTSALNFLVVKLTSKLKPWLALVAGLVLPLAYAPFGYWPLTFVSFATLFFCLQGESWRAAAKYGWLFGLGWFGFGISWVHVSIADFGGLPLAVSLLLMLLLCGYLALYPALAASLAARFSARGLTWFSLLLPAFAISEYLRGTILTGFPWLSPGYSLTDSPLSVLAPVIGEFGLTLFAVAAGFALFQLVNRQWIRAMAIVLPLGGLVGWAQSDTQIQYNGKQIKTALVQGNIQQHLRWAPEEFWPTMSKYQDLTRQNWDADLIVWPEAAIPEIEANAEYFLESLDKAATLNHSALITGIVDYQFDTKAIYNTVLALGNKEVDSTSGQYYYQHINRYKKHQLLPIGEFVPFEQWLRPIAPLFDLPMSSFSRGDRVQPNLRANGLNILPAICYEIAFSDLVRSNYRSESDILFTVSNDAWFGNSIGPLQHMQIARMRALELGRPLIRVTNNGVTGVFDPLSGERETLPQFETAVLRADVKLISGDTPFARYGNAPAWWLVSILLLSAFAASVLNRSAQHDVNKLDS